MRIRLILAALAATALLGCGGSKKDDTMGGGGGADVAKKSLYDRLGGKESIAKVVEMFVANVGADTRINSFFANTDATGMTHLKAMLVDQICDAASGGTMCKYTGKSMEEVHKGMGVKQEHFDALVEDLVKALNDAGVGAAEQQELLGVLGPMSAQIVEM
jgi:hemoglobin